MTAPNRPKTTVLLIQKEVAQRLAAQPGDMSILAVSAQMYAEVELDVIVPAEYFTPPPKVDSQVVVLKTRPKSLVPIEQEAALFRVVKAGFSSKRKKLRSSLSAGLHLPKEHVDHFLADQGIDANRRAEDLSIEEWQSIVQIVDA